MKKTLKVVYVILFVLAGLSISYSIYLDEFSNFSDWAISYTIGLVLLLLTIIARFLYERCSPALPKREKKRRKLLGLKI